ncbi:Panacea domain-containing protein [Cohnella algarum]|uniref:Panacea domain-containing protein n=1 Tax=Cohnella algarum TaxID=2044859 RepID=UPI001968691A|nr:type II toxin-antitoxin system antitoxin SocA domain-containing protein [Cohnella algarum]MBN2980097.1 SocA family protein [Cohnella algarum]
MGVIIDFKRRVRKMVTIHDVAKTFLNMESMSPKKLQKLCFYAYSWYLYYFEKPLFDNRFQAWVHGPVDPSLYHTYKEFGWSAIPREATVPNVITNDAEVYEFLESLYESYGHLDADELEALTHDQIPWKRARAGLQPFQASNSPIKDKDIIEQVRMELGNA